jgi:AraC-like DNA-binding protein
MIERFENQQEPLSSFPCFRTKVFDEWYNFMDRKNLFTKYKPVSTKNFYAFYNSINLGSITMSGLGNKSKFFHEHEYSELQGLMIFQLSGNSIATHDGGKLHSKDCTVRTFKPSASPYYFQSIFPISIFISFPNSALAKVFYYFYGYNKSLVQIQDSPYSRASGNYLRETIINIANILNNFPNIADEPLIVTQYEQLIYTAIIHCYHNNFRDISHNYPKHSSSKIVRVVEEYIEANIGQPLRLESLAALTGQSIRTIQESFKKYRGYSPSSFARECRLLKAKKILQESPLDASILSIALSCGFATQAHFSDSYKKRFGLTPLESLKKFSF